MRRRKVSQAELQEARDALEKRYVLRDFTVDAGPKVLQITGPVGSQESVQLARDSATSRRALAAELLHGRDAYSPSPESSTRQEPHWSELWPCARAMAAYFGHCVRMRSVDTIEFNCGLGTAALGAAAKGARVKMMDANPDAVRFAHYNALQNGFSHIKPEVFDWKQDRLPGHVGSLIFSDVLHCEENFEHVYRMLHDNLSPDHTAFLAEPGREVAMGFLESLRRTNYRVRMDMERVEEIPTDTYYLVSVLRIKKED